MANISTLEDRSEVEGEMKTLVIVPAYNEEGSLESTIESLKAADGDFDYVIVNDGSKDRTVEICRDHEYPFIDLPINLGLAAAVQTGMKYAMRHGYDCAIQFDADGQHRAEYISVLSRATEHCDIAIGSRFVDQKKPHTARMIGSRLIGAIIKLTTGKIITDPTSGMRAFNARMIKFMAQGLNMGPEPDTVSYLIKSEGARVIEVPVVMQERTTGESYLNFKSSIIYMLRMTTSILFIQYFRKHNKKGGR